MPYGPHVLKPLEDALSDCFEYHNEFDSFLVRAGLDLLRCSAVDRKNSDSNRLSRSLFLPSDAAMYQLGQFSMALLTFRLPDECPPLAAFEPSFSLPERNLTPLAQEHH